MERENKLKERVYIVLVQINREISPFPQKPEVRRLINSRVFYGRIKFLRSHNTSGCEEEVLGVELAF